MGTRSDSDAVRHRILLEDNVIRRNTAGYGGGGMELLVGGTDLAPPRFVGLIARDNLVEDNLVNGDEFFAFSQPGGGGVSAILGSTRSSAASLSLEITRNLIRNNVSERVGGGLSAQVAAESGTDAFGQHRPADARMDIAGNLIHTNTARSDHGDSLGGGVTLDLIAYNDAAETEVDLWLNTIVANTVNNQTQGGGVHIRPGTIIQIPGYTRGTAHVALDSNIVADNQGLGVGVRPPDGSTLEMRGFGTDLTVEVAFSDIVNNAGGNYADWLGDLTGLDGNVSVEPGFADPSAGDYHLTAGSALIDVGHPVVRPGTPDTDRDGDPRVVDGDRDGSAIVDMGYDEWVARAVSVVIDIKPGEDPNSVHPRSRGVIPVAILGTEQFDVATVDTSTVRFGPGAAPPVQSCGGHLEDVDLDGAVDLVVHFGTQETGIACGDASVELAGQTLEQEPLHGADAIVTVGCSGAAWGRPAIGHGARPSGQGQIAS